MVHRIQNRNSGYSDFSNIDSAQSFNFSPTMSNSITNGANALKLENEVIAETSPAISSSESISQLNKEYNEQLLSTQQEEIKNLVGDNETTDREQSFTEEALDNFNETEKTSNGLENFGIEEAPDLFSSDKESLEPKDLLSSENNENNSENDDLEIPAFLRRQKN